MNRAEKIRKLYNAVKRYRGVKEEKLAIQKGHAEPVPTTIWKIPPAPSAAKHVRLCLERFTGLDVEIALKQIDEMADYASFDAWLELLP